jgi:hypothetical protein
MPSFTWADNAEAIYDKSISATPFPFRSYTRDGLNKILLERFGEDTPIDEEMLVQVIKDNTPDAFLGRGMKAIAPLLTDPSLAEM